MTYYEMLEDTLVQRLMQRNGWDYPSDKTSDCDEYDIALSDIKWFLSQPEIVVLDPNQELPDNPFKHFKRGPFPCEACAIEDYKRNLSHFRKIIERKGG